MRSSDPEVRRVAEALRDAIRKSQTSQRDVERALGQSQDYLSQLLGGNLDLKLKHIFEILGVIGTDPADFFVNLYEYGNAATHGRVARLRMNEELEELKLRIAKLETDSAMSKKG